jgi:hypothetical protein
VELITDAKDERWTEISGFRDALGRGSEVFGSPTKATKHYLLLHDSLRAMIAERDALKEAVEWAITNVPTKERHDAYPEFYKAELRRRADAAKGGKG